MVILVKDQNGTEKALRLGDLSWRATELSNDNSKVELSIDPDIVVVIDKLQYESIKDRLSASGEILDLTTF